MVMIADLQNVGLPCMSALDHLDSTGSAYSRIQSQATVHSTLRQDLAAVRVLDRIVIDHKKLEIATSQLTTLPGLMSIDLVELLSLYALSDSCSLEQKVKLLDLQLLTFCTCAYWANLNGTQGKRTLVIRLAQDHG